MLARFPCRRPRWRVMAALVSALVPAVLATGCSHTVQVGTSHTLQVALSEYHVAPQSVRARAGTLSIFVRNDGRLTHNLVISRDGQSEASTQPIPPGQSTELITALTPGRYLLASTILSDQALGAYGTLTVTR